MGQESSRYRVVLLSGGLDSAAVLFTTNTARTQALFVDYGQAAASGELQAAQRLARECHVSLEAVHAPGLASIGAGRLSGSRPASVADGTTELQRDEWFPARNLVLVAVAGVVLGRNGGGELYFGASDPVYRDCQPAFFRAAQATLRESLPDGAVAEITVPQHPREEVLQDAVAAGLEPRLTFSCNRRGDRHCWRCASCRDRIALLEKLKRQGL
jgi:7-cyano-7-deazaguanine synthase